MMQKRHHASHASDRDMPLVDILARLDDIEHQLLDALTLARAGCLECQHALTVVAVLRSRMSHGVADTDPRHPADHAQCGSTQPVRLVDVTVPADERSEPLTAREREVLVLIADGRSNKAIALHLCLSIRTVERHINNIYRKIGAQNKADATAYALRHHLA